MYYYILAGGALAVLALMILSMVKDSYPLRMATITILFLSMAIREFSVTGYARTLIGDSVQRADGGSFADGVRAMSECSRETSYYVYFVLLAVIVICARGFRRKNKKQNVDQP